MNKIPMSPLARKMVREGGVDLSEIIPTGKDKNINYIRSDDVKRQRMTPLAKKLAEDKGIDVANIKTGARVKSADILRYAEELSEENACRLTPARYKIYENLSRSVEETIPYTLFAKIDTTEAYEYYLSLKGVSDERITMTDIFVYSASRALRENIILNTTRKDGYYINNLNVNISLAVDIGGNIVTPVMKDADVLSVVQISKMRNSIMEKISSSHLSAEDLSGGTFTVSNLGKSPVGYFTPVINYPQSAILGIGRTDDEIYLEDGVLKTKKVTHFSLTSDHAIIDGKVAAEFLKDLEKILLEVGNG